MKLWTTAKNVLTSAFGAMFRKKLHRKAEKLILITLSTILVLNVLVLAGCTKQDPSLSSGVSDTATESSATTDAPSSSSVQESGSIISPAVTPSIEENAVMFIDPYIDEAIALINADRRQLSDVKFAYEPKLLYNDLKQEEKTMYDELLRKSQELTPFSYTAEEHGYDVMNMVMYVHSAVLTDHPEIENYSVIHEVVEGNMTTALESLYFMPWDAKQSPAADLAALRGELLRFDTICDRIAERMPDDFSTYDKYRYLAFVISLITSYDYDGVGGWQVGTPYGSIVSGYSICQGYSRGFLYLCQKANLWCDTVDGVGGGNFAHMWNIVKLDSGTYYLDITWCDEKGLPVSPEWNSYFMLTQNQILVDHEITDGKVATGTILD